MSDDMMEKPASAEAHTPDLSAEQISSHGGMKRLSRLDGDPWAAVRRIASQLNGPTAALGIRSGLPPEVAEVMEQLISEGRSGDNDELQRRLQQIGQTSTSGDPKEQRSL